MKTARVSACLLLVFLLVGCVRRPEWLSWARSRETASVRLAKHGALQTELRQAGDLFRAARYRDAERRFREGYEKAVRAGEKTLAARFLGNLGASEFALRQYRPALESFRRARDMAASAGDRSAASALDINISSLYSQMGEIEAAAQWIEQSLPRISGADRRDHLPRAQIQLATLRARQGRMAEAEALFRAGIEGADRNADTELYATGWNRLGEEYLVCGDLAGAEHALIEAYRVRKLARFSLESSYRSLGRLRQRQGDLAAASVLLDRAVEAARAPRGLMPTWDIFHARGSVRLEQNRLTEAVADLRIAVQLARLWRFSGPPEDAARVGADTMLHAVYSALVEATARLYRKTGDAALLRESFEAAEENRAASLRALAADAHGRKFPAQYWETLSQLQAAEIANLRAPCSEAAGRVQALRATLIAMDPARGSNPAPEVPRLASRVRGLLRRDEALLAFHAGEKQSYLYAADRGGMRLYTLPGREEIFRESAHYSAAVAAGGGRTEGEQLYNALFGQLEARYRARERWVVVLDAELFTVPLAALVVDQRGGRPVYLAERHAVEIAPGAAFLAAARKNRATPAYSGPFVGVADPIYNAADPRAPRPHTHQGLGGMLPFRVFARTAAAAPAELVLPRLPGSAREVELCAAAWGGAAVLLRGSGASRERVEAAVRGSPAVLHFATHVLESGARPRHGLVALSLSAAGRQDLLGPAEIATWKLNSPVVALSGCASGAGEALPGAGLMGLARAWLGAGAASVVASYWPTPDDSGGLFPGFYRELKSNPPGGAAAAMQRAQMAMLRAGGWRAEPRYWAAFFVTGNY